MTPALPWHAGDHAAAADASGPFVVIEVEDGTPSRWYDPDVGFCSIYADALGGMPDMWPADAVPDLADVGTAARWLRSCAEVLAACSLTDEQRRRCGAEKCPDAPLLVYLAQWRACDEAPAAVAATREWLRVRGGER